MECEANPGRRPWHITRITFAFPRQPLLDWPYFEACELERVWIIGHRINPIAPQVAVIGLSFQSTHSYIKIIDSKDCLGSHGPEQRLICGEIVKLDRRCVRSQSNSASNQAVIQDDIFGI